MLIQADSRRRITLPPSTNIKPGDTVDIEILEDGCLKLIPVEPIPRHQLWAWSEESKQAVSKSLADPRPSREIKKPEDADEVATRWISED